MRNQIPKDYLFLLQPLLKGISLLKGGLTALTIGVSLKLAWDLFANQKKLCEFMVKNQMAKVSIMFERKKYVRTLTNLKVTFTDKLAAFGETLEFLFGTRCSFQIFFISRWDPWSVYWNEYLEHV